VIHLSVFTNAQQWNTAAALLTDITRKHTIGPIHMKRSFKAYDTGIQHISTITSRPTCITISLHQKYKLYKNQSLSYNGINNVVPSVKLF